MYPVGVRVVRAVPYVVGCHMRQIARFLKNRSALPLIEVSAFVKAAIERALLSPIDVPFRVRLAVTRHEMSTPVVGVQLTAVF
jgi:hypothetical protein